MKHRAKLVRLKSQINGDPYFKIGGDYVENQPDVDIEMGEFVGSWWDVPLPACPDCGGELFWAEAGHVPGARECETCGSLFSVETVTEQDAVPEEPTNTYACDNGHRWSATEEQDISNEHRCPTCGEFWQ